MSASSRLAIACGVGLSVALAAASSQAAAPPEWWADHVAFMSAAGGRWQTPNPARQDDSALPEAYGMEWHAANEGLLLIGRLYGIEAGREVGEYWTFREFYHPGEGRVVVEQWGGGAYGIGTTTSPEPGRGELAQAFWLADGRTWRVGHRTVEEGDVYTTHAFDIDTGGAWKPSSTFVWQRVAAPDATAPAADTSAASPGVYDEELARQAGADEYGMRHYVLVILKSSSTPVPAGPERDAMFRGHFANMKRLADEGKLVLAGPFDGQDGWRGLFVFDVAGIPEAEALVATDPVVEQGEMVAEYHVYYGSAALRFVRQTHAKLAKKSP